MRFGNWLKGLFRTPKTVNTERRQGRKTTRKLLVEVLEDRRVLTAFALGSTAFDIANAVVTDPTGNFYVAGTFNGTVDFDPGPGTTSLTSTGTATADAFLAKYNASGALQWAGKLVDCTANGLAINANGAVYMTGSFPGTTNFDIGLGNSLGTPSLTTGTQAAAYVAAYTPTGSLFLAKRLGGGTAGVAGDSITLDGQGFIYSAGVMSNGVADMDPGAGTFNLTNSSGNADTYISKLDAQGNFVWAKKFSNDPTIAAGVWPADIAVDGALNVYLTGIFVGRVDFDTSATTNYISTYDVGSPSGDGYVAKLTAAGDLGYIVPIGSAAGREDGYGIFVDAAGNAFVTGQFSNTAFIGNPVLGTISSAGSSDLFVMELNTTGGLVWARTIGGASGFDGGQAITSDGTDLYLTGYFNGTVDFDPNAGVTNVTGAGGFIDVFALRLKTDSTFVNVWNIGGNDYEYANDIAVSSQGNVAVVGRFQGAGDFEFGPGVTTLTSAGDNDAFVSILSQAPGNRPPTASNGTLGTNEDTPSGGTLVASDPDGNPLTYSLVSQANAHGTVIITNTSTGAYSYSPALNYNGPASFTFKANDGQFDSNIATVNITVNPVNDAPTANNGALTTNEDTQAGGTLVANDVDGNLLTYLLVSTGNAHGQVTIDYPNTGAYSYIPDPNYNGPASFTFKANDGQVDSNIATITITVNAVNDPPVAANQSKTTNEDTQVSGALTATDVEGSPLTYSIVAPPGHGQLTVFNATTGAYTYRPFLDYNGPDSFTFKANDGSLDSNTATVSITVNPVNDAPRPTPITRQVTTNEDVAVGGQLTATDPEGDPITFSSPAAFAPQHGSVTVAANGTWTYTPAANYYGTDIFGYNATDNQGAAGVGAVNITINPVNDAPVASNDTFSVNEDGSLMVGTSATSRLHMFSDPDEFIGQGLIWDFSTATAGFLGSTNFDNGVQITVDPPGVVERWDLNFAAPGDVLLVPGAYLGATRWPFQAAGEPGLDVSGYGRGLNRLRGSFTVYDVAYGGPGVITRFAATFIQQDHHFDDTLGPPLRGAIMFNSTFGAGGGVLTNDSDVEGDVLPAATLVSGPAHGTLSWSGDGTFNYTPFPDYNGPDSFTYRTTDGFLSSNDATVNINVNPVNDAPVASNGTLTTNEDTPANGALVATDVDGNPLTYSLVSVANAHGLVLVDPSTGAYTYTPDANFNGPASFTFKVNDGLADSNTATVNVTVNPVNDAPAASNGTLATNEDTPATGNLVATDVEGSALTYSLVNVASAHGLVLVVPGTGAYTYTPDANYNGPASFTFKANDGQLDSNVATINITVNPVNDAPVAANGTLTTGAGSPATGTLVATDVDSNSLTYSLVDTTNAHGVVLVHASTGAYTYTPDANFSGPASFTFKADDGLLDSNIATINITVNPPRRIGIDIQPGDAANSINIRSNGHLEVAILSTTTFNALRIDVDSLRFGRTGAEDSLCRNPAQGTPRYRIVDVNGDGRLDIVVTFEIELTGFQFGNVLGTLTGRTLDGEAIVATDMVSIRNGGR